jgi:KDO2-lipid IV(A) lauroyltransferase
MSRALKHLRYAFEGAVAWFFYWLFWLMGINLASAIGGRIARLFGPLLKVHRVAEENLRLAIPELSEAERKKILCEMWDNLGRVAAEASHIPSLNGKKFTARVNLRGTENLEIAKNPTHGAIIFSGHLANWELGPKSAFEYGIPLVLMYRMANNPWVEKLYRFTRRNSHAGLFAKGNEGAIATVRAIKSNRPVGMLVDQKMNEGIPVPFFGRDAMTAQGIAEFSLKYGTPLIPARVVRTKGAYFEVTIYPALTTKGKDTTTIMREVNALLEGWIREHPGQWMWVHKRWPK